MHSVTGQNENDPGFGKLRRLSSITSITAPIGQFASKFRRPSTAIPQPNTANSIKQMRKTDKMPSLPGQVPDESGRPPWSEKQPTALPRSRTLSNLSVLSRRKGSLIPLMSSASSTSLPRPPTPRSRYTNTRNNENSREEAKRSAAACVRREDTLYSVKTGPARALPLLASEAPRGDGCERTPVLSNQNELATFLRQADLAACSFPLASETQSESERQQSKVNVPSLQSWRQQNMSARTAAFGASGIANVSSDEQRHPVWTRPRHIGFEVTRGPRRSFEREITHRQLMQPISAPLPRMASAFSIARPDSLLFPRLVRQVSEAQPSSFWSGRYTSVSDRLLNQEMDTPFSQQPEHPSRSEAGFETGLANSYGAAHEEAHAQGILDVLYSTCLSEAALKSLRDWQVLFAEVKRLPNLAFYTPTDALPNLARHPGFERSYSEILQPTTGNRIRSDAIVGLSRNRKAGFNTTEEAFTESDMAPVSRAPKLQSMSSPVAFEGGPVRKPKFMEKLLAGRRSSEKGGVAGEGREGDREMLILKQEM